MRSKMRKSQAAILVIGSVLASVGLALVVSGFTGVIEFATRPTLPPGAHAYSEAALAAAAPELDPRIVFESPKPIPPEFSVAMAHSEGPGACGHVAFYRRPGGKWLASADIRMPDGTRPQPASLVRCGTCGRYIARPAVELVPTRRCE